MTFDRILVTGGSGLIGVPTVRHLADSGASVTVLDRRHRDFPASVQVMDGDVTDAETVRRAVKGQDAVVHLAGIPGPGIADDLTTYTVNTLGTYTVLCIAAECGIRKAVYASSINATGLPLNDRPLLPDRYPFNELTAEDFSDSYSLSKKANEQAAAQISARASLSVTGLRFPLVRDITLGGGQRFAEHLDLLMRENPRRAACEGWTYLDWTSPTPPVRWPRRWPATRRRRPASSSLHRAPTCATTPWRHWPGTPPERGLTPSRAGTYRCTWHAHAISSISRHARCSTTWRPSR